LSMTRSTMSSVPGLCRMAAFMMRPSDFCVSAFVTRPLGLIEQLGLEPWSEAPSLSEKIGSEANPCANI
jgi:hypothetical protein